MRDQEDWKQNNLKAVAILRVSSARQKDNQSHRTQEDEISQYCRDQGLQLDKVVAIVESAKDSEKRYKFQSAVEEAIKNKSRHLLFYMFDRESRNLSDIEKMEKLIKSNKIVIHYVRDRKIYFKYSSDSDFFLRDIQGVTNKQFVRNLSAKVTDAMMKKAEDGWSPSNHAVLGYIHQKRKDSEGRELKRGTTIIRDPNEKNVQWVQMEFQLRAKGFSYIEIRNKCIEAGLVPAKKIPTYRFSSVEKRLKNPFYDGRFRWSDTEFQGKHELIIPADVRQRVKETFGKFYTRRAVDQDHGILAGGFLRCADHDCGCGLIYDPKIKMNKKKTTRKEYHYYHCSDGKRVHKRKGDRQVNITEDSAWKQLGAAIESISIDSDLAQQIAEAMNEIQRRSKDTTHRNFEAFRAQLNEAEKREADLILLYQRGIIDGPALSRQHALVKEEIKKLTFQLEGLQNELTDAVVESAKSLLELSKSAKTLWESRSPSERRDLLEVICSNPRLNGASIEFDLRKPFCTLSEMLKKDDWRSQRDSNSCILREREVS